MSRPISRPGKQDVVNSLDFQLESLLSDLWELRSGNHLVRFDDWKMRSDDYLQLFRRLSIYSIFFLFFSSIFLHFPDLLLPDSGIS
jgi:hypothetical protein